jgi:hypothetical protein
MSEAAIFSALKLAQSEPAPVSDPPTEAAGTVSDGSQEPAGEAAPEAEEPAVAAAPEGEPAAEPTPPDGTIPSDEAQASETDTDLQVALRLAGNDQSKIPAKLREMADKYSQVVKELKQLKEKPVAAPPAVTPQAPAPAPAPAPALAAVAPSAMPDPQAIEQEVSARLSQDAEWVSAAQTHYANLYRLVEVYGGRQPNDQGQMVQVKGKIAELREELEDLQRYTPEAMQRRGIVLDEFAQSQLNPDAIKQRVILLTAQLDGLEARGATIRFNNDQLMTFIRQKRDAYAQHLQAQYGETARLQEQTSREDAESEILANTWNTTFTILATKLGVESPGAKRRAFVAAVAEARANPAVVNDLDVFLERHLKDELTYRDEVARDSARAAAVRKAAVVKPMAPPGAAAVASRPQSTIADPMAALKAADQARYVSR